MNITGVYNDVRKLENKFRLIYNKKHRMQGLTILQKIMLQPNHWFQVVK